MTPNSTPELSSGYPSSAYAVRRVSSPSSRAVRWSPLKLSVFHGFVQLS